MPLDFPSNPIDGQIYDNYYWDEAQGVWNSLGNYAIPNLLSNATFTSSGAANVPVTIKGNASQAANLQEWKNSSETLLASVNATGVPTFPGANFDGTVRVNGGGGGLMVRASQSQDHAYMSFYPRSSALTTRGAYLGYPSNGSNDLYLSNEISGGNMVLAINGSGQLSLPSKTYFPGAIVQVQQVQTSSVLYQTSHEIANISGLEISFTPKFSNSKILLTAMINSDIRYVATFGFRRDGTVVSSVNNNNSTGSVATVYYGTDTNSHIMNTYIQYAESAGSTNARTYTSAACASWAGSVQTLTINDRGSSLDMRSVSSMTIYEIAQ